MTKRRTDNTMTKRRTDNTMTKRRTDNTMTKRKKNKTDFSQHSCIYIYIYIYMCRVRVIVFNTTFNNISAISWQSDDDIRILRDIEQYYSTQIDEMPMNGKLLYSKYI
jgi:hypothetical protein